VGRTPIADGHAASCCPQDVRPQSLLNLARLAGPIPCAAEGDEDAELTWLMATFAQHGGVLAGDEVADLMRPFVNQPLSRLARWIVAREVVTIVLRSALFVPMFQFERGLMELRPQCREAVLELSGAMDNEEIALWFAAPNAWLDGAPPVAVLERDPDGIVVAARADRFIQCGW
jgi:hypothetical protein